MNKKLLIPVLLFFFIFSSCSTQKEDWENAESENTIAAYESFLKQHPKGKYVDSANVKIEELIWQSTLKDNSINGYEAYLKQYPEGKYADSASAKIKEMKWEQAALNASKDTKEVILYGKSKVIPYGRIKLLTIFDPRVLVGNRVEMSYKLENSMKEKPVLITSFTEANIAATTSSFYYYEFSYDMSEKKIKFLPKPVGWVSGRTKVRIYFVMEKDLDNDTLRAVSNVITLYLRY